MASPKRTTSATNGRDHTSAGPPRARLGRPPAGNSVETRSRILTAARIAFAERGYEATTNRDLSATVGVTSGVIYHHFGSKAGLYQAVHADVQMNIRGRFTDAVAGASTFRDKLDAVLDEAHQMNREDPTLAQFVGAVRVDMSRNEELTAALGHGEIDASRREAVRAFLATILIGLTDAVSGDQAQHSAAIDGIKQVLDGKLLHAAGDGDVTRSSSRRRPPTSGR